MVKKKTYSKHFSFCEFTKKIAKEQNKNEYGSKHFQKIWGLERDNICYVILNIHYTNKIRNIDKKDEGRVCF